MHTAGVVGDIHRVVAKALEICHDLVVLVEDRRVLRVPNMRKIFHDIAADAVCEQVEIRLFFHDLLIDFFVIIFQKSEGLFNIVPGRTA